MEEVAQSLGESVQSLWLRREPYYQEVSTHTFSIAQGRLSRDKWLNWVNGIRTPFKPRLQSHFVCLSQIKTNEMCEAHCCQAIEIRADLLKPENIKTAIINLQQCTDKAIIFTYRTIEEGGKGDSSQIDKWSRLAIRYGCQILDIELSQDQSIKDYKHAYIIGSCHLLELDKIISALQRAKCDLVKLVITRKNWDVLKKLFLPALSKPRILLLDSRESRYFNSLLTPVCLSYQQKTAPLQITLEDSYRLKRKLFMGTKYINKYYLFGTPITHSKSPQYHNEWFQNIKSLSQYCKYQTDNVKEVMTILSKKNTMGASITTPLKVEIIPHLTISKNAQAIGAVNTVTKLADGQLIGENTDWLAMRDLIQLNISDEVYTGLVIGTGGVAKAACYTFQKLGIPFYIWGRNDTKVADLVTKYSCLTGSWNSTKKLIIIICIPSTVELDLEELDCELVLELAYTSKPNRKYPHKCMLVSGLDILIAQATYQSNIWMSKYVTGIWKN